MLDVSDVHIDASSVLDVKKTLSNNMIDVRACNKPVEKLWFRGVRSSKFRHVYGAPAKREHCYENIKITKNAHDGHFCAVNPKFVAVVTEVAGGGTFVVLPISETGRLDFNASRVTGHRGPVLDIKWNPFNDNIIASCSDDCTVKLWYIPDNGLATHLSDWIVDLHGHKRRVGYIEWHPTAENILVSAGFDHLMIVWDVGSGDAVNVIDCHPDVIYSMSFNRDGSLIATTCKDKKLRVIEPRKGIVFSEGVCHAGTKACKAVFLGNTGRILTTGFSRHSDRQYAVWSQSDLSQPLCIETIDSSSGVLFPYYDHDTRVLFLAGKGDGNIRYYEVVDQAPWLHYLNQFLSGSPQRGLGFMPKRGCDVHQCEIFRFYKLHATKGMCEPISMIVPRKSDQFQDDLYPDTAAPTPALSAQEWLSFKNRNPVLMSMKTGVTVHTHKPRVRQPRDNVLPMANNNNSRKFAFLSQETVPDYRPIDVKVSPPTEKSQKTESNQTTKFQQLQQMFANRASGQVSTQSNQTTKFKQLQQMFANRASGQPNNNLLNEEYKRSSEERDEVIALDGSPKSQNQLQRAYSRQCEELKLLKKQLANRERRVSELEEEVQRLRKALGK
ncbi:coronin-2B-like isoform X2 [Schistocerca americana]|uniref:coronin-2B-like isoform X2 n=1 Tax=Schistocerca americana TaxID=7009 RepID=UPI001F4FB826|nr:coronin-2B-like isoform X2 [Schistocerca americana]